MGYEESGGRRNFAQSDTSGFDGRNDKGENNIVEDDNKPANFRVIPAKDAK